MLFSSPTETVLLERLIARVGVGPAAGWVGFGAAVDWVGVGAAVGWQPAIEVQLGVSAMPPTNLHA